MKTKWHIWEQRGDAVTHIKEGSVRLGRTLRAARRYDLTTQNKVFVAKKDENELPSNPRYHAKARHPSLEREKKPKTHSLPFAEAIVNLEEQWLKQQ